MSRFASPKTTQIWAERIAKCERSNAPVAQFCQSIGCSPAVLVSSCGLLRVLGGRTPVGFAHRQRSAALRAKTKQPGAGVRCET
jgi:hypothetical protein